MIDLLTSDQIYGENLYRARIIRHIDADTTVVTVDTGFGIEFTDPDGFRWFGIDAAERNTDLGKVAIARVNELLPVGSRCLINTQKDKNDRDVDDKYGRYLAQFFALDGQSINHVLVDEGFAVWRDW